MGGKTLSMGAEARGELPAGFAWQEVPQLRAAFPRPDGWSYRFEQIQDTQACFITRESFHPGVWMPTPEDVDRGQGFKTGLSVNSFAGIARKLGVSPAVFARSALTTNRLLVPESGVVTSKDGPLASYKGYFTSLRGVMGLERMPSIRYYMEAVGNNRTDRAYVVMFETPAELWEQDKEIAKVIIDNRVLDRSL